MSKGNRNFHSKQIGYELACGLQIGKQTVNAIYDWDNYSTYYHKDLLGANNNIIISSSVISGSKVYELINLLAKTKVDDSIMRVLSKEIASELMEITFGDNG